MGTISLTYNGRLTSMNLHEFIILMNLPIGGKNLHQGTMKYNIKYTIEYILKLQIHQHSLLTRKVFSQHNSLAQVFFSRSSSNLDHRWIFIKSVSSLLDHHDQMVLSLNSTCHGKFYRAIPFSCWL